MSRLRRPHELAADEIPVEHRPLGDLGAVEPLLGLCAGGKLYEVEAWIADGRPIQFPPPTDRKLRRRSTALQIAVTQRFHSLAGLLLANGYNPNGDHYEFFTIAARARDYDMVKLLVRFGGNPNSVDFCTVLETCDRELMDLFISVGVDPCRKNAVAHALYFKARPILGFIKQYLHQFPCLKRQIDLALHSFTDRNDLRGIALMLWLGADPHADTPASVEEDDNGYAADSSAFQCALWSAPTEIVTQFLKRPIPQAKVQKLLSSAPHGKSPALVRRLLQQGANPNHVEEWGYPVLYEFINVMLWRYGSPSTEEIQRGLEALDVVLAAGAKWSPDERQVRSLRRRLAQGDTDVVTGLIELLRKHQGIPPSQLHDLTRTPSVQKLLKGAPKPHRYR